MKIYTELVGEETYYIVSSDFLNMVSQGKTQQEALDNFDKILFTAVHLAKKHGVEKCFQGKRHGDSI